MKLIFVLLMLIVVGCAGMKVVNPKDENKDKGTKALDWSGGKPKIVPTFSCKLESGKDKFSAIGKTEEEARKEVLARCRDKSIVSFCKAEKIACVPN